LAANSHKCGAVLLDTGYLDLVTDRGGRLSDDGISADARQIYADKKWRGLCSIRVHLRASAAGRFDV